MKLSASIFNIDASGEELLHAHPPGNRVDVVNPIAIPADISYGRKNDATDNWYYFDDPTPGFSNVTEGFPGILTPPVFLHTGGFYDEEFLLEVTHTPRYVPLRLSLFSTPRGGNV